MMKVFSMLSTGETTGLFQLESAGMREAIKQMKPNKFDDIVALVLYIDQDRWAIFLFIMIAKMELKNHYIHPTLKEI